MNSQLLPEEIFASKNIKYYDQAIGIIVAETEKLANRAALLVKVDYKVDKKKPILTINDARDRDPSRISLFIAVPAKDRGLDVQKIIKGCDNIYWQYHYTMETISAVTKPSELGLDVYAASQFLDSVIVGLSEALNIAENRQVGYYIIVFLSLLHCFLTSVSLDFNITCENIYPLNSYTKKNTLEIS